MAGNILKRKINEVIFYVMFKTRGASFYRAPSGFRSDKTRAARFLTPSKTFLEKHVSREFITIMLL